jgi:imidazolonepropionase-like amidohydrolase
MSSVRPSEFAVLRQLFADAKRAQSGTPVGASPASANVALLRPDRNPPPTRDNRKFRALFPILDGKLPMRVRADTAADIRRALELTQSLHLGLVIEGGAEAYRLAGELSRKQIPVVTLAEARPGARFDKDLQRESASGRFRPDAAAQLAKSGVSVSIASEDTEDAGDPIALAAMQVSYGMGRDAALRAVTINPAKALGVQSRVGSLEIGKDADLLVLSGDPLDTSTRVELTLVNGAVAYERDQASSSGTLTAIRAGRILTVSQGEIINGTVLVRAGKIVGVRRGWDLPEGATLIDASRSTVMPGMIDAYSYLGLHADNEQVAIDQAAPQSGPISGRTKLLAALTPRDEAFADALRSGVTEVLLAPPPSGAFCGRAALLKTIDDSRSPLANSRRIVKEGAAVCFNFAGGAPRRSQSWSFRDLLQSAKSYNQRRIQYNQDYKDWQRDRDTARLQGKDVPKEPAEVVADEDLEPLAPLFRGEIPAFVHAGRADEIVNAVKLFRDEFDLPMTLVGGQDSFRVVEEIRKRGASVALGPDVMASDRGRPVNDADVLSRAGVPVLFQSSSASGSAFLRLNAAAAVRNGLDPVEALRAMTIYPARALRVENRLGSIEAGKDADLVILSGYPLNLASRVQRVMVDGKVVYDAK